MQLNNNNNNSSNIKIKKTKENQVLNFITVKYIFKDKIKFDDYFSFNIQNGLYFCNICNCFKGSKRKFCIERHLLNSHFANREYCNICNKYYVRINEHNSKKHNNNQMDKYISSNINSFDNLNKTDNYNNELVQQYNFFFKFTSV